MTTTEHPTTSSLPSAAATDGDLTGRVAIVTGAGTGIGAATARSLAARGAGVALLGRRAAPLASVAEATGGLALPVDVTDRAALDTAVATVRERLGRPDLVVANAGAMLAAAFEDADREEWRRMIDVNLMGLLDLAQATVSDLLDAAAAGGRADLVLISSLGAQVVMPDYAVYFATKAAVTHLARNLRAELGPRGVRVHGVEPGMTASDLGHDMADAGRREALGVLREQVPPIPASALGDTVAWLATLPAAVNLADVTVLPTVQG